MWNSYYSNMLESSDGMKIKISQCSHSFTFWMQMLLNFYQKNFNAAKFITDMPGRWPQNDGLRGRVPVARAKWSLPGLLPNWACMPKGKYSLVDKFQRDRKVLFFMKCFKYLSLVKNWLKDNTKVLQTMIVWANN